MTITPLRFVSLGFGYSVCASKIFYIMPPNSVAAKRKMKAAKEAGKFLDFTFSRATKALIIMDDDTVIGCAFSPSAVMGRLARATAYETTVEEGPDE